LGGLYSPGPSLLAAPTGTRTTLTTGTRLSRMPPCTIVQDRTASLPRLGAWIRDVALAGGVAPAASEVRYARP
jgi:hypothetical protein